MELKSWLAERGAAISKRWHAEIQVREDRRGDPGDGLLGAFLNHLVEFLPPCFGEKREEAEEVWEQATHLYGSLALRRGLSAGEGVEELGLLREEIFKLVLPEISGAGGPGSSEVRDVLALNRLLDQGVVRASVAYLDDLFFAHLQGSGIPGGVTPEVEEEIRMQLDSFSRELGCPESQQGADS